MDSPYIKRFIQADSIIPDPSSPQTWNRYSYVGNRPINYNDPTGHIACGDGEDRDCVSGGNLLSSGSGNPPTTTPVPPTNTPTPTPTGTPTSTPSNTPAPTPVDPILQDAQTLIQQSDTGRPLYTWALNNGFKFDYSKDCAGHLDGTTILLNPCNSSVVYAAGQIAHEIFHYISFRGNTGSQEEEYKAYMIGDSVRAELISKGYGTGSRADIFKPLTSYTVQFENNPNLQVDLANWFEVNNIDIYVRPKISISGTPTGYGLPPFPLTFTPRP